ncbi:MAG TPA: Ig-like domain-containing protein [Lelliottia sp.]
MRGTGKITASLNIILYCYLLVFHSFLFSFPAQADEKTLAADVSSAGTLLSQNDRMDAVINSLVNSTSGKATSEVQQWLQQYGTARVNVGVDRQFSLASADFDLLLPLYDKDQHLIFTQSGIRRADDRNVINLGVGYRHFSDSWMWGVNTFYDQQISDNTHQRLGVGGELGWDYLKLSANGYARLSGWKDSTAHEDYEERVANGYDLRAEGYLPAYPQLGMQLMWEQYYGKDVALMGSDKDQRQRNPYAVTAGLNYTPVPLVTLGVNHKAGKGDQHESQVEMNINWMAGVPFADQLDADNVQARRTLRGSRLELVSRNNNIVLEYRKKELISLSLPQHIEGVESQTLPVAVKIATKYPLSHIVWQDSELMSHGGKISENNGAWSIVLPEYQPEGAEKNMYVMSATAYDSKGNASDKAWISVEVKGYNPVTATTQTTVSSDNLIADGVSSTPVTLTVISGTGKPIGGVADQLSAQLIHPVSAKKMSVKRLSAAPSTSEKITPFVEQSPGVYVSTYTSGTTPGTVIIQSRYNSTLLSKATITLLAANTQYHFVQLDATQPAALANGQDAITLTAQVINTRTNQPAVGVPVTWQVDNPDAVLSAEQSVSDAQGHATVMLTSKAVLGATVTAGLENGETVKSTALQFTTDLQTAKVAEVDADKLRAKANGQETITLSAHVVDASEHPLANQPVKWAIASSTNAVHLSDSQSTTDDNGVATISLTAAQAGDAVISAATGSSAAVSSKTLTFTADPDSAVMGAISASKTSGLANGQDGITLSVKVVDANKNPVQGAKVAWQTASATAHLSAATAMTDDKGEASVSLTSSTVEALEVSAKLGEQTQTSATLSFTSDSATATAKSVQADKTQATANDNDRVTLTAKVVDASDHPVAAAPLKWTVVQGQATLSDAQTTANAQGESVITVTSEHPGTVVVSASSTAGAAVNSAEMTFIADTATAKVTAVTVDKTQALANGADTVTYSATVKDAEGNPLNDQLVNWAATPATAKLSGAMSRTDATGVAIVTMTSKTTGDVNVSAKAGGGTAWNAPVVTLIGDVSTAQLGGLKTSKSTAVANGVDKVIISGQVTDRTGNPLNNIPVAWSVTPSIGLLSQSTGTSDAQGQVSVELSANQLGSYLVKGVVNGDEETSQPVTFNADVATAAVRVLTADKTADITAGRDTVTLAAVVKDDNGLPIEGMRVAWSGDNANGEFSTENSMTDSNGIATATYGSTLAMPTQITARAMNKNPKTLALDIVPDLQSATPGAIDVDKNTATANGSDPITLSTVVKDQYGNVVKQALVSWHAVITSMDYSLSADNQPTDANGQSSVTITSTDRGPLRAVATFNSTQKTSPIMVYISDTATEKVASLVASQTTGLVAGVDTVSLQALVTDENDNPVRNAVVYWRTDNDSVVFQLGESSVTDFNGIAETSFMATTAKPTVVGVGINNSKQTLTVDYIADPRSATLKTLKADKTKAVADGQEKVTWVTNVKDGNGNNLSGVTVNWSSDSASLALSGTSSVTDAMGNASILGSTTQAGDAVVTATLPGTGGVMHAAKVSFIGDSKTATVVTLTSDKTTVAANGADAVKYTATVKDSHGNLVPNTEVLWTTSLNKLTATSTLTSNDGVAYVSLSGHDIGLAAVTAQASAGGSTLKVDNVLFINNINDSWVINSATSEYKSPPIVGFPSQGFVTVSPTVGPTSLDWAPSGYANVSTPIALVATDGKQYSVNVKGYRQSYCTRRPLNAAVTCEVTDAPIYAVFTFDKADNPTLPAGHYIGIINFRGEDWHSSYTFDYKLTVDLTVQ